MAPRSGRDLATDGGVGVAALVAVVVLAGCGAAGQSEKANYRTHLARDVRAFDSSNALLKQADSSSEPLTERLKQFDKAQRVARTAVADLSSVKPPGDAVQDTAVLVKAMRLLIGGSDQIWEDVLHGNSFGAKRASLSLKRAPVFRAAAVAVRDLKAKGYFGNG
jgi:hypothetical protein